MRFGKPARPQRQPHEALQVANAEIPYQALLALASSKGGGLYAGAWPDDGTFETPPLIFAPGRRCMLVCAPSQAGKTSCLAIPQVLSACGPVVSTSTKLDVFHATAIVRGIIGRIWVFDVGGTERVPGGARRLRWSPIVGADTWDGALATARVMTKVSNPAEGLRESTFWTVRSSTILALLLHLAALSRAPMDAVMAWAESKDAEAIQDRLVEKGAAERACSAAEGVVQTAPNEASGFWSTVLVTLAAYQSQAALDACRDPNFDPAAFVKSLDTVYVTSGTDDQDLYAPLIVGLVESIRKAAYEAARRASLDPPLYFILDEAANIAPLPSLPSLCSEAPGRGIFTSAYFQSLRQAKARWGDLASDFMTLFTERVLMPGVNDRETLELFSSLVGEYDHRAISQTINEPGMWGRNQESMTTSFERRPILPPQQVAAGPGPGYYWWHDAEVANWQGRVAALVATPWYAAPPWPQVIASSMARRQGLPLPVPDLAEEAFEGVGRNWYPEYVAGKVQHKPLADQRGRELPPLGGYSRS